MAQVDAVVIGAGVIGLAIARALALRGLEVVILEAEHKFGQGTSARNSEVIHAGLYYSPGSRKAHACVNGRRRLYAYAQRCGIAHRKSGKLVVATGPDEEAKLAALLERGRANGVEGLQLLSAAQARALEPELQCSAALLCAESGLIDTHAFMLQLLGDAEANGAAIAYLSPFAAAAPAAHGWILRTGGAEPFELSARWLVNAAGLQAQQVASAMEAYPAARIPPQHWAKGNYFKLQGRSPFSRLIYPLPVAGGLGVHLTLDLQGQAKFGPDVQWVDALDYRVDPTRAASFYGEVRRYWPGLPDNALVADYAGIRPKLSGPADTPRDFEIDGPGDHGLAGLVHLFGIESPGITASLALAEEVAALLHDSEA
jgi:L-2-hydroxyglutarate oxidase LhgO